MKLLKHLLTALIPIVASLTVVFASLVMALPARAVTTANITITATPSYVAISVNDTDWNFGTVTASTTVNTSTTTAFEVNNLSTVITNVSIAVNQSTWTGGVAWSHNNTGGVGADEVGLLANKAGTWGTGDVIVKSTAPNNIAVNQAATTNFTLGLGLHVPSSFSDGTQKTVTVVMTATAA